VRSARPAARRSLSNGRGGLVPSLEFGATSAFAKASARQAEVVPPILIPALHSFGVGRTSIQTRWSASRWTESALLFRRVPKPVHNRCAQPVFGQLLGHNKIEVKSVEFA